MAHVGGSSIIPTLRYRDPRAAIAWLCKAFGFEKHAVYENDHGEIEHAQLVYGTGTVMLGGVRHDEFGQHIAQPDEIDGRETQGACVVMPDCKAHERAKAAGAVIVNAYAQEDYGGGGYSCRDREGRLWHFGSYDPWQD